MITIVDYRMGNLGSIQNMLKKAGVQSRISSNAVDIAHAEKLIIPGVGAFDSGMHNLRELGLIDILSKRVVEERTPVLGICLGMQLMTLGSEEGVERGLGWISANTIRFEPSSDGRLKVPHMGWCEVTPMKSCILMSEMYEDPAFYFVHSYFVKCRDKGDVSLSASFGMEFDAAIQRDNIFGVQFHPEKSHKFGMQLLRNFASLA